MTAPISSAAPAAAPGAGAVDPKIREAAQGLEGVFISMLVDQMLKGTEVGQANPVYSGLMTEKLGDQLARSGGFGLADTLERRLGGVR